MTRAGVSFLTLGASTLALAVGWTTNAHAQEQAAQSARLEDEEIIITARHRDERVQDVPIPVSAIAAETLETQRLDRVTDYAAKIPSFAAALQNTRVSTLTVRGLGANANSDGSESSVGVIVDNVFYTHPGFAWLDLVDLESVQVARGPQGTLLGKNTTLGALVVTTHAPSFTPEAEISVSQANYDRRQVRANVSGPLSESLAGRLTIYADEGDGWIENRYDGNDLLDTNRWAVRGQLLFQSDALSNRFIAEHFETREYNNFYQNVGDPHTYANGAPRTTAHWYRLQTGFGYSDPVFPAGEGYAKQDTLTNAVISRTTGFSNELNVQLGDHRLTSVTAWRDLYFRPTNDAEGSPFAVLDQGYNVDVEQTSQEFRLASPDSGDFTYQVGVYLLEQDVQSDLRTQFFEDAPVFFGVTTLAQPALLSSLSVALDDVETSQLGRSNVSSAALFGQSSWRMTDRATLTTGLRYTWEDRKASNQGSVINGGASLSGLSTAPIPGLGLSEQLVAGLVRGNVINQFRGSSADFIVADQREDTSLSWLFNPSYQVTDDLLAYFSASYGEKSGAANLGARPGDPVIIDPEEALDYEFGLKATLWEGRAFLNTNLYWTELDGYHGTQVDPTTLRSILYNVGSVRLNGVELEGGARLTEGLRVSFSAALNEAEYTSFANAPVVQELAYAGGPSSLDLSGTRIPTVARYTGQLSVDYERPIDAGATLFTYLNQTFRSDTALSLYSQYGRQDQYGLTNAGIGLRADDDRWALQVWGKNLTDERYAVGFSPATLATPYIAVLGEPRTFGVSLTYRPF